MAEFNSSPVRRAHIGPKKCGYSSNPYLFDSCVKVYFQILVWDLTDDKSDSAKNEAPFVQGLKQQQVKLLNKANTEFDFIWKVIKRPKSKLGESPGITFGQLLIIFHLNFLNLIQLGLWDFRAWWVLC